MEESWLDVLINRVKNLGKQIICVVINSVFLSLWVVVQYLVKLLIQKLELSVINRPTLIVFQVIFALSTLAPVILFFYKDLRIIIIRVQRQIRKEAQFNETNCNDNS
jgi:hypothetical protein